MENKRELSKSLVESIKSSAAKDIAKEYVELGVDALIESEAYKNIPVVNTIFAICNIGIGVNDYIFTSKITKFICELDSVTQEERNETIEKLESDKNYKRKVGEYLLDVIGKIDSERKPEMLAKVFVALAKNLIDVEMFYRLSSSVERVLLIDLPDIRRFSLSTREELLVFDEIYGQSLLNAGLATTISVLDGLVYTPNGVCRKFVELELDL